MLQLQLVEAATRSPHAFSPAAGACCLMAPLLMASRCVLGPLGGDVMEDTPPPTQFPPLWSPSATEPGLAWGRPRCTGAISPQVGGVSKVRLPPSLIGY